MQKEKVLISDHVHPVCKEELEIMGYECDEMPDISPDKLKQVLPEYAGLIVRSRIKVDAAILRAASNLKFIGRLGSGMENIDIALASEKGIQCFNSPEGNRNAVAEHACGMILSLFTRLTICHDEVKRGIWKREENKGMELEGKIIGIIGYGNTGSAFAKCLSGFDVEIVAYDKYKNDFSDGRVKESEMQDISRKADIVSLHVPLTEETHYLVKTDWIQKFEKNVFLINTSRGSVVKTSDLVQGLKSGKIKGCCLDVLEYEKLGFDKLMQEKVNDDIRFLQQAENVILSPHVAGHTHESYYKLSKVLTEKIGRAFHI